MTRRFFVQLLSGIGSLFGVKPKIVDAKPLPSILPMVPPVVEVPMEYVPMHSAYHMVPRYYVRPKGSQIEQPYDGPEWADELGMPRKITRRLKQKQFNTSHYPRIK